MCFSAGASFGAGVILGISGVFAIKKIKKPEQRLFAALPFIFSAQQFSEGFLWLALNEEMNKQVLLWTKYYFFGTAQIVWPICLPLSLYLMEQNKRRKYGLMLLSIAGLCTALLLGGRMFFYELNVFVKQSRIVYNISSVDWLNNTASLLYSMSILIPGFVSTLKGIKILALTIAASLLVTLIYFNQAFISVWCYFAAILSTVVLYVLHKNKVEEN